MKNSFHYIQPFADIAPSTTNVELILDNNAFIEATKSPSPLYEVRCVPNVGAYNVNPFPALAEQWISNPDFWSNRHTPAETPQSNLISKFMAVAEAQGHMFAPDYAADMIRAFQNDDSMLRGNIGILFAYIAVITQQSAI